MKTYSHGMTLLLVLGGVSAFGFTGCKWFGSGPTTDAPPIEIDVDLGDDPGTAEEEDGAQNGDEAVGAADMGIPVEVSQIITPGHLVFSKSEIEFGSRRASGNSAVSVTLMNDGENPVSQLVIGVPAPFSVSGCEGTLAPLETCTLTVQYSPIQEGESADALSIAYYDGLEIQTNAISVTAHALLPGSRDPLFGSGGRVDSPVCNSFGTVAVQPDGKIVAGGTDAAWSNVCIARFLKNGQPDLEFGSQGVFTVQIQGNLAGEISRWNSEIISIIIDLDGSIFAGGTMTEPAWNGRHMVVLKLTPDGRLDDSFNSDGIADINLDSDPTSGAFHRLQRIAFATGRRILIVGDYESTRLAIAQLTPSGQLDPDFNQDGFDIQNLAGNGGLGNSVTVDELGNIFVVGYSGARACLIKYNALGVLDQNFGVGGIRLVDNGIYTQFYGVRLLEEGSILATGWRTAFNWTYQALAMRFDSNGNVDTTFGDNGAFISYLGETPQDFSFNGIYGVGDPLVFSDHSILMAAYAIDQMWSADSVLAQLTPAGVLDSAFLDTGYLVEDLGGDDSILGIAKVPSGDIEGDANDDKFIAVGNSAGHGFLIQTVR